MNRQFLYRLESFELESASGFRSAVARNGLIPVTERPNRIQQSANKNAPPRARHFVADRDQDYPALTDKNLKHRFMERTEVDQEAKSRNLNSAPSSSLLVLTSLPLCFKRFFSI